MERRLLQYFADDPTNQVAKLPGGLDVLLMYLIKDKMIAEISVGGTVKILGLSAVKGYQLTQEGKQLVESIRKGDAIP